MTNYNIENRHIENKLNNAMQVTKAICNKGFSANSRILPRIKFRVGGQVNCPQSLATHSLNRCASFNKDDYEKQ